MIPTQRPVASLVKLNSEFLKMAGTITDAYLAVGMITGKMFDFVERNLSSSTVINIVVGVHMPTPPEVMERLYNLGQEGRINVLVFASNFFHPKLYLFKSGEVWTGFVGSGNLTYGGWSKNEELFVRVDDQVVCFELYNRFLHWQSGSIGINKKFLQAYAVNFLKNADLEQKRLKNTKDFVDFLTLNSNLDNVDFSSQYFKKSDFMTFDAAKVSLDNKEIWEQRAAVRNKLYKLNAQVARLIPKFWNIQPHYSPEYIASQVETKHHDQHLVRSLWVGYGRDQKTLKSYGDFQTTPLYFMRMQFIIHHDTVGFWLMPAKAQAGKVDRLHFAERMEELPYRQRFFDLVSGLDDPYWIHIAGEERKVSSFKDEGELHHFMRKDTFAHYFIIGRDYNAGDSKLNVDQIANTCLEEFTKYYPLYDMILHRL